MTKAAANDLSQQVNQLQPQIMEANKKIVTLASDQQKTAIMISTMQASLNAVHQEISDLKITHDQLVEINKGTQRTANGHGRGGQ